MTLVSEVAEKKQQILIVDKHSSSLAKGLKAEFEKYDNDVFYSPHLPRSTERFDFVFWFNPELPVKRIEARAALLFVGRKYSPDELRTYANRNKNYQIITIGSANIQSQDLERIIWFSFTKSEENFLRIDTFEPNKRKVKKPLFKWDRQKKISKKNVFVTIILFLIIYNGLLFSLLGSSLFFFFRSASALAKNNIEKSQSQHSYGSFSLKFADLLYRPLRQPFHFFSVALWPDNLLDISARTKNILDKSFTTLENSDRLTHLIFKKNKTDPEKQTVSTRIKKLESDITKIEEDLVQLNEKLPKFLLANNRFKLGENIDLLQKSKSLLPFLEEILGKESPRKYLLFFANNMEIRPGGGFIGSFGIINVSDLTIQEIQIYDVYDADGQLTKHIDPPDPIREHLNQPNWFLRDSAFSPDFFENYSQAKYFLNTEINQADFAGAILLTTSAIQNIIEAYGNVYVPDYEENITKDNFYIKAQLYSEKDFFPGSTQKKSFLGAVARQITINLEDVSSIQLFRMIKKSLDEKQMVVYFDNQKIQSYFDSLYWSGKMISPRCIGDSACVLDYVFPVDANLGVNKANFFVNRNLQLKVKIDKEGKISNELTVNIRNESSNNIFPGGNYKNYFQIFLPPASVVTEITKNNVLVESFDESLGDYKKIGFLAEVPSQKSVELKIKYQLIDKIKAGKTTYQLIFQKQIGSKNSDLKLEFELPDNITVANQNFTPLVKGSSVSYNTSLTADKIFLMELQKK